MSPNSSEKVPLTVIGGFLGSGKTTFLNALIREGIPEHSLIVVNDFGDINIDAELVDYRDDQMLQLSNGCICCTLGGTLAEQLAKAMRLADHPRAIFLETSGVADPARIADIAKVSTRLELAEVICLVDGSQARRHQADRFTGDTWHAQLYAATRILLNRLPSGEETHLTTLLRQLNPTARIEIMDRRVPDLVPEQHRSTPVGNGKPLYHIPVSRGGWKSVSLPMNAPVDAEQLQALLLGYRDVLLRAKGFLYRQDRSPRQLLQFSGDRVTWQPAAGSPGRCQLVCIGRSGERFDVLVADLQSLGGV
ncbi:CobW family GTP-binding protein [Halomonas kalidii]|uniref:GTP-binding protein n=1 Tax=Halomonas kalidii TaxID=3043293 RepID=A0ABT6VHG4_9GAMM|nr:CobW family GTP-binding protein [Halomonas kalidii]MDI5933416.1 GTP-binding protein [Halomonas kalidii]